MAVNGATLSIGKGYTNQVALGLSDVTIDNEKGKVTFTLNDGSSASWTFPIPSNGKDGKDGISIVDVEQTDRRHFRCVFSNGTKSELITLPIGQGGGGGSTSASDIYMSDGTDVETAITETEQIAKGRSKGYVFDTVEELDEALEDEEFTSKLLLGDNLYIRATDVPDYWWDGSEKQKLETQKVDMTEYYTKAESDGRYALKGEGGGGEIYSLDETVIGTWMGKPLYRKVVKTKTPSSTSATSIFDLSSCNIDEMVNISGVIYTNDANNNIVAINSADVFENVMFYSKKTASIRSITISTMLSLDCTIVIEYTKTTD